MQRRFSNPYLQLAHNCWHYAGDRRPQMILFYALAGLASVATVMQPYVIGLLINGLQRGGPHLMRTAVGWLSLYVLLMFLFWLFHGPARVIERNLAFYVRKHFLQHYYDVLTHLPMHWHRDHHTGNTMNRLNKAARGLYEFSEMQFVYIENAVRFFGAFLMLIWISREIALVEVGFAVVIFIILLRFDKVLIPLYDEVNEREHHFSSVFFDTVSNIASVISFNLASFKRGKLTTAQENIQMPLKREIIVNELKWFTMMMLVVVAEFVVMLLYMRGELAAGGALMLGNLVAVYQYMTRLNFVFFDFAAHYQRLIQQRTDLAAVAPLLDSYQEEGLRDEGKPVLKVEKGAIHFDHIRFAYRAGARVFDGLDLAIAPRQKVGLIGRSGAGKTTLLNLLLRFYDAEGNAITIDGQAIGQVTHESLCANIAVIPQDTSLFEATLMENIRCGRLDATDEEVMEAARKAHAHEFIAQLHEGYGAKVGERGVKLSAGQRQRIAIARAILKDAPILVLDEATSALDSESEEFIQESLVEVMEGKTVIAIAHRLSTIAHLDRLVVLDGGRIVEEGSHGELLRKGGPYSKLWGLQSGGFLPD